MSLGWEVVSRQEQKTKIKSSPHMLLIALHALIILASDATPPHSVLRNAASLVLPNASSKTRKATCDQKMASRVSCIAYKLDYHLELLSSLPLNGSN